VPHASLFPSFLSLCAAALLPAAAPAPELYPLTLERGRYLPAPLTVTAEDLTLTLEEGAAFFALAGERPTALVLVGRGRLTFAPPVESERRQLQIFAGAPALATDFESAFIRLHPEAFPSHVEPAAWREASAPAGLLRQAEAIFREEVRRSFAVAAEAGEASEPPLSVLPPPGDFLAEIRTPRRGLLTYARVDANPEDILLADRARGRRIVSYPSREHRRRWGFAYGDEHGLCAEVTHSDLEVAADPPRGAMSGRAVLSVRAVEECDTVSLRLDSGLLAEEVRSAERGAHVFLQQRPSDTLLVKLAPPLAAGGQIALQVTFRGSVRPQELHPRTAPKSFRGESGYLYSNRVYWFPQSPVRNHATATLRVKLPAGFHAIASGLSDPDSPVTGTDGERSFLFRTEKPVRYLALFAGKFGVLDRDIPAGPASPSVRLVSFPRLAGRAGGLAADASRIARFYGSLLGDVPFPALTVALVATSVPAAHSPAYLVILGEPPGFDPRSAEDDPAYFPEEPAFFLAHEIAHQWWGQAVGWRNYREQWLSEAFAQYFTLLYVEDARGEGAFRRALAWMGRWAKEAAGRGSIDLGIRAGEVDGCAHCFSAIVQNRGAYVLHMLRGLLGDEAFFRGLKAYYGRWKFRRAGTDDFRRALEESSGRDLARFFDQWVREDGTPRLRWSARESSDGARPQLRLRLEQLGEPYELPLRVSIEYRDRPPATRLVHVFLPEQEFLFDLEGRFRRVRLNEDFGALCDLVRGLD